MGVKEETEGGGGRGLQGREEGEGGWKEISAMSLKCLYVRKYVGLQR